MCFVNCTAPYKGQGSPQAAMNRSTRPHLFCPQAVGLQAGLTAAPCAPICSQAGLVRHLFADHSSLEQKNLENLEYSSDLSLQFFKNVGNTNVHWNTSKFWNCFDPKWETRLEEYSDNFLLLFLFMSNQNFFYLFLFLNFFIFLKVYFYSF